MNFSRVRRYFKNSVVWHRMVGCMAASYRTIPRRQIEAIGKCVLPVEKELGEDKAKTFCYPAGMDEGRKRTILIAASIPVAQKWAQLEESPRPHWTAP